jgi:hypothetical protein
MCLPGGVSNRTVARASAANSRRSGATAALDRAQAHRDPVLGQQLLLHHVGVAAMPLKPFRQPVRETVQRLRPLRPPAARPAAKPEVPPDRVPAAAELGRDPLPAHPKPRNPSIAATSSGVSISSLRRSSICGVALLPRLLIALS